MYLLWDSEIHTEAKHYYIDFRQKIMCLIYDINASIHTVRSIAIFRIINRRRQANAMLLVDARKW